MMSIRTAAAALAPHLVLGLSLMVAVSASASSTGRTSDTYNNSLGCNQSGCHNGGMTPSSDLTGTTSVAPGSQHEYTFTVSNVGPQMYAGLNAFATQGTFAVGGANSASTRTGVGAGGRVEITHMSPKAAVSGTTTFSFLWTAPSSFSSITIKAWGNSVNFSNSPDGDQAAFDSLVVFSSANGGSCSIGSQCLNGFCVDGACCSTSSCPIGQSCNVAGMAGDCQMIPPEDTPTPTQSPTPTSTRFPVDYFKMYKAKPDPNPDPFPAPFVDPNNPTISDTFSTDLVLDILKPATLANPVSQNGTGILNSDVHLECYKTKNANVDPPPAKFQGHRVQIGNWFETRTLDLKKPASLCMGVRMLESFPPPPPTFDHNNFRCFKAKDADGQAKLTAFDVQLNDDFEDKQSTILKPDLVCDPTLVNTTVPPTDPDVWLVCYKIKTAKTDPPQSKFTGASRYVRDSLTAAVRLKASKASHVCMPSTVMDLGLTP